MIGHSSLRKGLLLLSLLGTAFVGLAATPDRPPAPAASASAPQPAVPAGLGNAAWPWSRSDTFAQLGNPNDLLLSGTHNAATIEFQVRSDRIVRSAELDLGFTPSPALLPTLSHLRVYLNGELMGVVPIGKDQLGKPSQVRLPLDARLISDFNQLRIEFVGHYTDVCEDLANSALWVDLANTSQIRLDGEPLAVSNDLANFPLPFFDPHDTSRLVLPVVFAGSPSPAQQQAAAVMASYFGSLAGWWRQASFPVSFGTLPASGNAVVMATNGHFPPVIADHAPVDGPQIELMSVPGHADRKLLLVLGRDDADLQKAVMAMAAGNVLFRGTVVKVDAVKLLAPRKPYDAPNWVRTDRPIRFGELLDYQGQLHASGAQAGPLTLHLNLPPDLFIWRNQGIPLKLLYRYTPPLHSDESRLTVSINNQFIASFPLLQQSGKQGLDEVRLPVLGSDAGNGNGNLLIPALKLGDRNNLSFDFTFASTLGSAQRGYCQTMLPPNPQAQIDDDSTIDFSGFHHYIGLPNLSAFALSGFPFTRMADLSQTVALVPPRATAAQVELLLDAVGGLGAQSGYPGYGLRVIDDWKQASGIDADLLVLGSLPPDLRDSTRLSLMIDNQRTTLQNGRQPSPQEAALTAARGTARPDPAINRVEVSANAPFAAIIGLQSPFYPQRSVVSLAAGNAADDALLDGVLTDVGKREAVAGSVAVVRDSGVSSQFVGSHYYVGSLPWWLLLWFHLADHPVWLAVLATLSVLLAAFVLWRLLRRLAQRRLAPGK